MTLVDLLHQVQKRLPVRFGGTGNPHGWATDTVVGAYVNGTGSTIARGTVVELANYITMGGGRINDSRIKPTSSTDQLTALGVVVGRFRVNEPANEWEDVDAEDGDVAAVCIFGKCLVTVESEVAVGEYAYTAATDGQAYSDIYLRQGGFGMFESAGEVRQWLRIFGTSTTPGVVGQVWVILGDDLTTIPVNTRADWRVPFPVRILDCTLLSTYSGSVSVDLYRDTYANFPPTPTDSVTASSPPTITSGIKYEDTALAGWTTDWDQGDTIRFNVESASALKQVSILLRYIRR